MRGIFGVIFMQFVETLSKIKKNNGEENLINENVGLKLEHIVSIRIFFLMFSKNTKHSYNKIKKNTL